jgi:signal transduction histidine kinase
LARVALLPPVARRSVRPRASRPRSQRAPILTAIDGKLSLPAADRPDGDAVIRGLVAGQELERRRIARDLHDVVGQALTAVKLNLEALRRDLGTTSSEPDFRESIEMVDQAMRDVRDIAFDLRPAILDDLGLVAASRWYLARQARIIGYRSTFHADAIRSGLGVEVEAACFRTLQEALTNVARHAKADEVHVRLIDTRHELVLLIEDDGVGFDPLRRRRQADRFPTLGLIGASERVTLIGGTLEVTSQPGQGTSLRATFPRLLPAADIEG